MSITMKRTLGERLKGLATPEKVLRTHPYHTALKLTSTGQLIADLPLLTERTLPALNNVIQSGDVKIRALPLHVQISMDEKNIGIMLEILRINDAHIISDMTCGSHRNPELGTGSDHVAKLSTGKLAIRVPNEMISNGAIVADAPFARLFVDVGAVERMIGHSVVLCAPENLAGRDFNELDAANAQDIERVERETAWSQFVKDSQRARPRGVITIKEDRCVVRPPKGDRLMAQRLVPLGFVPQDDALVADAETIGSERITTQHVMDVYDQSVREIQALALATAKAQRNAMITALAKRGIDARQDPEWVLREADGTATFMVPRAAGALLTMLAQHGKAVGLPGQRGNVIMHVAHDEFVKIAPLLPLIKSEIEAVKQGGSGSEEAMRRRVENRVRTDARQSVRNQVSTAQRSRTRRSVSVEAPGTSLLDPANPIGLIQMQMWVDVAHADGVRSEAQSQRVNVSEAGGQLCIEPPRGDVWEAPASTWAGGSSDYGSSTSSSSYDSTPTSSCD